MGRFYFLGVGRRSGFPGESFHLLPCLMRPQGGCPSLPPNLVDATWSESPKKPPPFLLPPPTFLVPPNARLVAASSMSSRGGILCIDLVPFEDPIFLLFWSLKVQPFNPVFARFRFSRVSRSCGISQSFLFFIFLFLSVLPLNRCGSSTSFLFFFFFFFQILASLQQRHLKSYLGFRAPAFRARF